MNNLLSCAMLRRLLHNLLETAHTEGVIYPNPFSQSETLPLGWLSNVAPCFPLRSSDIAIIWEPSKFYEVVKNGCASASKRIVLVSLYLGTGCLERALVDTIMENPCFKGGNLKVTVLLDYMRGSRFENNSRTVLQPLLQTEGDCEVSLYHTPVLRGLLKRITPNRWNELAGLQHMKLYIFDDMLVISGANLSEDYFTNRQDRYFVIKDKPLCDFYCGLVQRVQTFSLRMGKLNEVKIGQEWDHLPYAGSKRGFIEKAGDLVEEFLVKSKQVQNSYERKGFDTWIFPLVQMGQLGVNHDSDITHRILAEAPSNSTLCIATGYFNLTSQYRATLINESKGNYKILMAHPKANGFLGAKGLAGGIPYAYSLIAWQFQRNFEQSGHANRIKLFEYLREGWTYHGKGLWYYPPNCNRPCLTMIGSPNFGERSVNRDLETQLAIVTENDELRERLHEECGQLYKFGTRAETERVVPMWVHGFVLFFRNYF